MNPSRYLATLLATSAICPAQASPPAPGCLAVESKMPNMRLEKGLTFTGVTVTKVNSGDTLIRHEDGLARISPDPNSRGSASGERRTVRGVGWTSVPLIALPPGALTPKLL